MDIDKIFNLRDELPYITLNVFLFTIITLLLGLSPWICVSIIRCPNISIYIPDPILSFILLLNITLLLIAALRSIDWLKQYNKRGREIYKFDINKWPNGWIYNGLPEVMGKDLHIKSLRAGLLLEEKIWKNCRISFELKFDKDLYKYEVVGVIFRAKDLDNYFMIEIRGGKVNGTSEPGSLTPHVRFKSGWEATASKKVSQFNFEDFRKIEIYIIGKEATFFYENEEVLKWILPSHVDVSHFEAGVDDNNHDNNENRTLIKTFSNNHTQKISFREDYGMVGFRAHHGGQGGIIRNLQVEPM